MLDFATFFALELRTPHDKHMTHIVQFHIKAYVRTIVPKNANYRFELDDASVVTRAEHIETMRLRGGGDSDGEMVVREEQELARWDEDRKELEKETIVGMSFCVEVQDRGDQTKGSILNLRAQESIVCRIMTNHDHPFQVDSDWLNRLLDDLQRMPKLHPQEYLAFAAHRLWHTDSESQAFLETIKAHPYVGSIEEEGEKRKERNAKKKARKARVRAEREEAGT